MAPADAPTPGLTDAMESGPAPVISTASARHDHALVRGVAWTGAMKWLSQAVTWASMIVLARILTPADYGLVGMATLFLGLVTILTEFGLGASILTIRGLTDDQIAQLNTIALALGVLGSLATVAAAWPLGWFFEAPELPPVVVALSVTFLIASFKIVPTALLQRALRFRALALIDAGYAVLFAALNVGYALLGLRYWALVLGGITANTASALVLLGYRRHRYARPQRTALGPALQFSGNVLVSRMAWYVYSNSDFMVAGKLLGKSLLGAYTFAWSMASLPVEKITALVGRVTPAVFSELQDDNAGLRRTLINVTEGLVYLTLPASLGIAIVADDFVRVVLGDQWLAAIWPLRLLAVFTCVRSVTALLPQILMAKHDTAFLRQQGILTALVMPVAFVFGAIYGGPPGIAAAWLLVYPYFAWRLYHRTFARIELPWADYLRPLYGAIRGTLFMTAAVLAADLLLPESLDGLPSLLIQIAVGVVVFGLLGVLPARDRLTSLYRTLRRRPERPDPSSPTP